MYLPLEGLVVDRILVKIVGGGVGCLDREGKGGTVGETVLTPSKTKRVKLVSLRVVQGRDL